MFMWDLRDLSMMRAGFPCEEARCMKSALHKQIWAERETELSHGTDRKLMAFVRTSVADEAVFEVVL